jgi:hypothetical protein
LARSEPTDTEISCFEAAGSGSTYKFSEGIIGFSRVVRVDVEERPTELDTDGSSDDSEFEFALDSDKEDWRDDWHDSISANEL